MKRFAQIMIQLVWISCLIVSVRGDENGSRLGISDSVEIRWADCTHSRSGGFSLTWIDQNDQLYAFSYSPRRDQENDIVGRICSAPLVRGTEQRKTLQVIYLKAGGDQEKELIDWIEKIEHGIRSGEIRVDRGSSELQASLQDTKSFIQKR